MSTSPGPSDRDAHVAAYCRDCGGYLPTDRPPTWPHACTCTPSAATVSYCECYGDPEGAPLCDECQADEREQDEGRAADLFEEDVRLYGI